MPKSAPIRAARSLKRGVYRDYSQRPFRRRYLLHPSAVAGFSGAVSLNVGPYDTQMTTGNSGFTFVSGTTYYTTPGLGNGAYCAVSRAVFGIGRLEWGTELAAFNSRFYFMTSSAPSAAFTFMTGHSNAAANNLSRVRMNADLTVSVLDIGTAQATSTATLAPWTVYRADYSVNASGSTQTVKFFSGANLNNAPAGTADFSVTGAINNTYTFSGASFGALSANSPGFIFFGDCAYNTTAAPAQLTYDVGRQFAGATAL